MEKINTHISETHIIDDNSSKKNTFDCRGELKELIYKIVLAEYRKDIATRNKPFEDKYYGEEKNKPYYENYIMDQEIKEYKLGLEYIKLFMEYADNFIINQIYDLPDIAKNYALNFLEKYGMTFPLCYDFGMNGIEYEPKENIDAYKENALHQVAGLLINGKIDNFTSNRLTIVINYLYEHKLIEANHYTKKHTATR